MTLAQVNGYANALAGIETEKIRSAAIAARAAHAPDKAWDKFLKELDRGR